MLYIMLLHICHAPRLSSSSTGRFTLEGLQVPSTHRVEGVVIRDLRADVPPLNGEDQSSPTCYHSRSVPHDGGLQLIQPAQEARQPCHLRAPPQHPASRPNSLGNPCPEP